MSEPTPSLPPGWTELPIEELFQPLADGRKLHHGWSPQCDKEPAAHGEWGVLKTTAVQDGAYLSEHNKRLPAKLKPRTHFEVKHGDLLITCAGPRVRCGVPCLVRETRDRLILSGKMYRFRVRPEVIDSRYMEAYLRSPETQRLIDKMKTGISDSGLNLTHSRFFTLQVPVAPPAEQRCIVAKIEELFSDLDAGVAALERVRANLKRYRAAVLKAAVEGRLTEEWRTRHSFVLASDNDTTNADAQNVTGDQVLEEHQSFYMDDPETVLTERGQLQMTVAIHRHSGTTTTGALDAVGDGLDTVAVGNASFRGRAQITTYYYDEFQRPIATVNIGTNGGTTFTRSNGDAVPSRSDTRLVTSTVYDGTGSVQSTTDPRGLVTRHEYDHALRRTKTINNYVDGTPSGDTDQTINYAYSNGLMTSMTANPEGGPTQTTTYSYANSGGLSSDLFTNRLLREVTYPAGDAGGSTTVKYGYNRLGQQKSVEDQSGNVTNTTFDALGRETVRTVATLASGFDGAVRRVEMGYLDRGLPSTVTQYNATTGGTVLDQVRYAYDGWGNGTNVYQDVDSAMDASGVSSSGRSAFNFATTWSTSTPSAGSHGHRVTGLDYKAGGTSFATVGYAYGTSGSVNDTANRVFQATTTGGTVVAEYGYMGMGSLVTTKLTQPGLRTSVETAAGVYGDLDAFNRPTKWNWSREGASEGSGFYDTEIAYDRNSNPTSTKDLVRGNSVSTLRLRDVLYTLDGLNRVTGADQGHLSSGAISNRTRRELWNNLSLTGNWENRQLDANGDGNFFGADDRNELIDNTTFTAANEWTGRRVSKSAGDPNNYRDDWTYDYNPNGQQIRETLDFKRGGGSTVTLRKFRYDPFGRLTAVFSDESETNLIAEYRYNGLGQRIMWRYDANFDKTVGSTERYHFMYDDRWRVVGVFRDADSTPKESFVYHAAGNAGRGSSSYIDSVILRDRDANGGGGWTGASDGTLEERRFYTQNWRADVVAITKSDGNPLEYVFYSAYGEATVHPIADVDMDGDVDSADATAWDNGDNMGAGYNYHPAGSNLNWDDKADAADDALFDESYAANVGLSGKGRMSSVGVSNRKGYAGYEHDESIGMYHVRHRVYQPDLGRWMTRDPLGYVDGMGLYEYVRGMAVVGVDPQGLWLHPTGRPRCMKIWIPGPYTPEFLPMDYKPMDAPPESSQGRVCRKSNEVIRCGAIDFPTGNTKMVCFWAVSWCGKPGTPGCVVSWTDPETCPMGCIADWPRNFPWYVNLLSGLEGTVHIAGGFCKNPPAVTAPITSPPPASSPPR